jgi:hypothetical protein
MTEISYIELLRMAHEQLDSQSAMIEVLEKLTSFQGQSLIDAEIEIAELVAELKEAR